MGYALDIPPPTAFYGKGMPGTFVWWSALYEIAAAESIAPWYRREASPIPKSNGFISAFAVYSS